MSALLLTVGSYVSFEFSAVVAILQDAGFVLRRPPSCKMAESAHIYSWGTTPRKLVYIVPHLTVTLVSFEFSAMIAILQNGRYVLQDGGLRTFILLVPCLTAQDA